MKTTIQSRLAVWALTILMAVSAGAADVQERVWLPLELNLSTARELCLEHNPRLQQFRSRLDEQDGVITELRAARRPSLNLDGSTTRFEARRQQDFGSGMSPDEYHWGADLTADITVYSGGRNRRAVEGEEARKRAVQADLDAAYQNLVNQVYGAFFDALLAQEAATVQRDAIQVLEEQLRYTKSRAGVGVVDPFEVTQAEVALANARPPLVRVENDYRRAIESLRLLIGLPLPPNHESMDVKLEEPELPAWEETSFEKAVTLAAENRAEIRALDERREAQVKQLEIAQRGRTPLLSLFAGYGIEGDQFGEEDYLSGWMAGAVLNWTLVDGGVTRGRSAQEQARLDQVEYQYAELALSIGNEVRQALYDYEEARLILATADQVIAQAEEALRLSSNRHRAGRGIQLDVLESQLQLTRSRLEQATARRTFQQALIDLRRAIGQPL